ncbi:MAG: alpha/beta fold hydrolase [Myxococcota bacterium]|nr:alpha/beta fold hydrolase [Myxococcota bacterium]
MHKMTTQRLWIAMFVGAALTLTACGEATTNTGDDAINSGLSDSSEPFVEPELDLSDLGGDRPSKVYVPTQYTAAESWPLVVLLHGFTASGYIQDLYMGVSRLVDTRGFILLTPDGLLNQDGSRFWNATDFCCDFYRQGPDDVGYIMSLIDEAKQRYNISNDRVYLMGHSNGGFLSHRIACEHADQIAGIMSLAGTSFLNASDCQYTGQVSVLHIHGTADETILYDGAAGYPGAVELVERWRARNKCTSTIESPTLIGIDQQVAGDDTAVVQAVGCEANREVELWTIEGGGHVPYFEGDFVERVLTFLFKQAR